MQRTKDLLVKLILTDVFRCKWDGQLSRPLELRDVQPQALVHAARLGTRAHRCVTLSAIPRVKPGLAALGNTRQKEGLGNVQYHVTFVLLVQHMAFNSD